MTHDENLTFLEQLLALKDKKGRPIVKSIRPTGTAKGQNDKN